MPAAGRVQAGGMTPLAELKNVHRSTWAAGDYAAVAELIDDAPPRDLLARAQIEPGLEVLDVATGTGNMAIKAAAAGAQVVGLDLTPGLLETARRRAGRHDVAIDWVEGDAEDLPFADASFDRVLSVFGVQFAPRHKVTARELARVCRPGGLIGVVNWTPDSLIGDLFKVLSAATCRHPPTTRRRRRCGATRTTCASCSRTSRCELEFGRGSNPWRFESPEHWVVFMETHYGPTLKARERLTAEGRWDECRAEILALTDRHNEARDGRLYVEAEYLVVVGRRA